MKSISGITTLLFTFLVLIFVCSKAQSYAPPWLKKYTPSEFTSSVNRFSINFYKAAAAGEASNSVMSPLSADVALSLLSLGAYDETFDELKTALDLSDSYKTNYKSFVEKLRSSKSVTVKIANKIYVAKYYLLNEGVKRDAVNLFNSEIQNIDFAASETAAEEINQWVENQTNNKIKKLVSPSTVDSLTQMVMVNAIYFLGKWEFEFDKNNTKKEDFFVNPQMSIKVDMMHQKTEGNYANIAEWDAKILELDYIGAEMSLVIILPNKKWGLTDLERKLTSHQEVLSKVRRAYPTEVDVALPKFRIETKLNLRTILPKLGIRRIFDSGIAQLHGLFENKNKFHESTFVGTAIQKAFIDVNEGGTEAAAATYVSSDRIGGEGSNYVADHPFIYILKQEDDTILFMGKFTGISQ